MEYDGVEKQARDVPVSFRLWVISKVQRRQLFLVQLCKCRCRVHLQRSFGADGIESLIPK